METSCKYNRLFRIFADDLVTMRSTEPDHPGLTVLDPDMARQSFIMLSQRAVIERCTYSAPAQHDLSGNPAGETGSLSWKQRRCPQN